MAMLIIIGVVVGIALYFIPSILAERKGHKNFTSIKILNIFLGWTFIGWVIALMWVYYKE